MTSADYEQAEFEWDGDSRTIQAAFQEYHEKHPEVFSFLVSVIYDLRKRGYHHYGIGALWERMRWHFQIDQDLGEEFKCNNNYRSRYVRLIITQHPDLEDFFELRTLRTE